MPAWMLFTKRNENRAWSQVIPKEEHAQRQYKVRADEAFKTDIKKIRKTTEQEVHVNTLIKYHERNRWMQKNTKAAKEAHTELRNCKQEIKEIKKFNEFRAWWTKCQIKVVKNIPVCLLSSTYITGVYKKTTNYFLINTSEQHKATRISC